MVKSKSIILLQVLAILVAVTAAFMRFRVRSWTWMSFGGLALAVPSFLLWLTARVQLGRSFSVRAKATELVTHGLYSRIRNPVYVFGTLFVAGFILIMGKPIWLLLPVALIPMQIARARKEARVLEEKFGEQYRLYRTRTWF
jgi:protein-S-isoprenylcysteine O-methyltransferase Ste14